MCTVIDRGKTRREFLYVDDMTPDFVNVGTGEDIEIGELAKIIAHKMNFKGELVFDSTKPDGTMRKLLDVSKIKALGWRPEISLDAGLDQVIKAFLTQST